MSDYIGGVATVVTVFFFGLLYIITWYKRDDDLNLDDNVRYRNIGASIYTKPYATKCLFVWRILCCFWFFGFTWIGKWTYDGTTERDLNHPDRIPTPKYWYFTNWNLVLLGWYFLFSSICSLQYLIDSNGSNYIDNDIDIDKNKFPTWYNPKIRMNLVNITTIMYDVVGGNAFLVTVVAFTILDQSSKFWNITNHLTNTLFLLVETGKYRYQCLPQYTGW